MGCCPAISACLCSLLTRLLRRACHVQVPLYDGRVVEEEDGEFVKLKVELPGGFVALLLA